ncbi:MAG TPA: 4,5-dihydroxyphthalate dehydrogenase, partial [Porphyromonadaceae bacterium]|nr:4,5-dihydroxyphthalate dehydrogenase [Porphyromonadaceae bacterium]
MKHTENAMSRRKFLAVSGAIAGTTLVDPKSQILAANIPGAKQKSVKTKVAVVGLGNRGTGMWGGDIVKDYADQVQYVGLCDHNPGRLEVGSQMIGANCPTYTNFEQMMRETKPDQLIITTDDNTHDYFVEKGMEMGADIICEKPMAIDEKKIQTI